MNPLLTAIFDRNPTRVRTVAQQQPELLSERLVSGELPIEFAASDSAYIRILVYLIRSGAPGSERFTDWQDLLESYVRDLSDSFACAGWLNNIEFILWCLVVGDPLPCKDPTALRRSPKEWKSRIYSSFPIRASIGRIGMRRKAVSEWLR